MRRSVSMTLAAALLATPLVLTRRPRSSPVTRRTGRPDHADALDRRRGLPRGEREGLAVHGADRWRSTATASLPSTTYTDPFGAGTARSYDMGTWTSSVVELDYPIDQAISSWNAITPTGTWVETSSGAGTSTGLVEVVRPGSLDLGHASTPRATSTARPWTGRATPTAPDPHRHVQQPQEAQARGVPDPRGPVASGRHLRRRPRLDAVTTMSSAAYPEKLKSTASSRSGSTSSSRCRRTPRTSTPASSPTSVGAARCGARRRRARW